MPTTGTGSQNGATTRPLLLYSTLPDGSGAVFAGTPRSLHPVVFHSTLNDSDNTLVIP